MNLPAHDFTLFPGEWYFGGDYPSVQTLLGSCVSVTVWHPILKLGGMCHYLLPASPVQRKEEQASWRYGINALKKMAEEMAKHARLIEYEIGCYGGAQMFDLKVRSDIGRANIDCAKKWLREHNLVCKHVDVGGYSGRKVRLYTQTGSVEVALLNRGHLGNEDSSIRECGFF